MPDKDNNFGGHLVLNFKKLWRPVQPKNKQISSSKKKHFTKAKQLK